MWGCVGGCCARARVCVYRNVLYMGCLFREGYSIRSFSINIHMMQKLSNWMEVRNSKINNDENCRSAFRLSLHCLRFDWNTYFERNKTNVITYLLFAVSSLGVNYSQMALSNSNSPFNFKPFTFINSEFAAIVLDSRYYANDLCSSQFLYVNFRTNVGKNRTINFLIR